MDKRLRILGDLNLKIVRFKLNFQWKLSRLSFEMRGFGGLESKLARMVLVSEHRGLYL
jgi:hypothetical protein